MMADLQCLRSFEEFRRIRREWEDFTERFFPDNYSRTHGWLSAWWSSYHHGRTALVYLQRDAKGSIIAAAPLLIRKENFGGFPVRTLQPLGSGIGSDDLLRSPAADGFIPALVAELRAHRPWDVGRFQRLSSPALHREFAESCSSVGFRTESGDGEDYLVSLPRSFDEYQRTRSRKFRRNLNQAVNRLQKEGEIRLEVLDPVADAGRVHATGCSIARTCWQFREGKSHFNRTEGNPSFYANLAAFSSSKGEEFSVLTVAGKPVAYLLGCRRGRTYYAVDTAFHSDYRHVSAGRILFAMVIERLVEAGETDCFDFEGGGEYKTDYATDTRKTSRLVIYNRSLYPLCVSLLRGSPLYALLQALRARREHRGLWQLHGIPGGGSGEAEEAR